MHFVTLNDQLIKFTGGYENLMLRQDSSTYNVVRAAVKGFWWIGLYDFGLEEIKWASEQGLTNVIQMRHIGLVHGKKAAKKYMQKGVCPEDCRLSKQWTLGNGAFIERAMQSMHKTIIRGKRKRNDAGMANAVDYFAGIEYQQLLNLYKVWQLRERPYFMEVYRRMLRSGYRKFKLGTAPNVR